MRIALYLGIAAMLCIVEASAQSDSRVLFIGNSFTYGFGSPVRYYRSDTVNDLNDEGTGGMPALFKSFTQQAGLAWDVHLETRGGSGLDFHYSNKQDVISSRRWDAVVMHGFSTLDRNNPRDPSLLIETSSAMTEFLREQNRHVRVYLMATWSRADQTYLESGAWSGEPIYAMARDVRAAYDTAAAHAGAEAVIAVGEAWNRAMQSGVADSNPYDGIEAEMVNLWTYDHYHASAHGLYLEALVVFGSLTGRDPRSLGAAECSGFELGFSRTTAAELQRIAYEQLLSEGVIASAPEPQLTQENPRRCAAR